MATVRTCADCSTQYALDLAACPHCGSSNYASEQEGAVVRRLPLFVNVACTDCGREPWVVRLRAVTSGLIELPTLACASCGSRVPVTWPPEEEPVSPKNTVHGGATNARAADVSPTVDASEPQVVAEDGLGHPDPVKVEAPVEEAPVEGANYDGMTLAELRAAAEAAELPSHGNKAQLIERLKGADKE